MKKERSTNRKHLAIYVMGMAIMALLLPASALLVDNNPGGEEIDGWIQVTHTMDDRNGTCSEGSVIFFGQVVVDGEMVPNTPVTIEVTGPEDFLLETETDGTGHYSAEHILEECCTPGYYDVVGTATDYGLSDGTQLVISPPGES